MTISKSGSTIFLFAATSLVLTACGGGGGGGGNNPGSDINIPLNGVAITADNAPRIGANALYSMDAVLSASSGMELPALGRGSRALRTDRFNLPEFILQQLQQIPSLDPLPVASVTGVAVSQTQDCLDGGTLNVSGELADKNTLTPGDTFNISYSNCNDGGYVSNGSTSMTITQAVGFDGTDTLPFTLGVDIVLNRFSVTYNGVSVTSHGDMTLFFDFVASGSDQMTYSGDTLISTISTGQGVVLTQYLFDTQIDDATEDYRISQQGTLASTEIGGAVSFTTTTPFTGNGFVGDGNPTAGQLHITTGADASQAWLTAQSDGVHVVITVDRDGNGIVDGDGTITTTWVELEDL